MLQETNGPQYHSESGASVAVEPHSSSPLPNNRLSDQEQADNLIGPMVLETHPKWGRRPDRRPALHNPMEKRRSGRVGGPPSAAFRGWGSDLQPGHLPPTRWHGAELYLDTHRRHGDQGGSCAGRSHRQKWQLGCR